MKTIGRSNPDWADTAEKIAVIYLLEGRLSEAKELAKTELSITDSTQFITGPISLYLARARKSNARRVPDERIMSKRSLLVQDQEYLRAISSLFTIIDAGDGEAGIGLPRHNPTAPS